MAFCRISWHVINVLVGFFLLGACVSNNSASSGSNGSPPWYTDTEKSYPNASYLAVRAFGGSEREAERNAAGELSTLFSARIQSNSTATFRYAESGDSDSSSRSVEQSTRIRSDQEISGLEYSEPYRAGSRVYIVAYLDRNKVGKLYSERIADRRDQISELRSRAKGLSAEADSTEDLLSGFILYDYAVDLAMRNQALLEQLQIINKSLHERVARTISYNSVSLAEGRSQFASRLSFEVNYEGDADLTFLGENIADQISSLGFSRKASGSNALILNVNLGLTEIETDNRYINLAWDLQVSFLRTQNADASGSQSSLLEFSKSGRESGITKSRTTTTLKRMLDETIQREFMTDVFAYFSKFAGV